MAVLAGIPLAASAKGWSRPAAGVAQGGGPEVLLTFDDGPHHKYSARILDELRRRGLQAVFFWVGHRVVVPKGRVEQRRALVARAVREGHLVGNHTITHARLCRGSAERATLEVDLNQQEYELLTGLPIVLFRAPYGAACGRVRQLISSRKLRHMYWDLDPDELHHKNADRALAYVQRKLRNLEGRSVLLMHDTREVTTVALPRILDWIDTENRARRRRGQPPIRIISGSEWVLDTVLDQDLRRWADRTYARAKQRLRTLQDHLPFGTAAPAEALLVTHTPPESRPQAPKRSDRRLPSPANTRPATR